MKKQLLLVFSMIVVLVMIFGINIANSEHNIWNCPQCGRTGNTGNYCGGCAHSAPWIIEPASDPSADTTGGIPNLSETYPGSDAHLRISDNESFRVFSNAGPGKSYVSTGGYKPYKQKTITVYFEENEYVFADVVYQTAEERFVYLPKKSFDSIGKIPVISNLEYYSGKTTSSVSPSWGPDSRFTTYSKFTAKQGTTLKIFFQENDYVYAEYTCSEGTVRMWLPIDNVEISNIL